MGAGASSPDVGAATARGIVVGNTPGALTDSTADIALLLMLATARRAVEADRGGPFRGLGRQRQRQRGAQQYRKAHHSPPPAAGGGLRPWRVRNASKSLKLGDARYCGRT